MPARSPPSPRLSCCLLAALCWLSVAGAAHAQAQRCRTADGQLVFTDQPCSAFDAEPERPAETAPLPGSHALVRCNRSAEALAASLGEAIDLRDPARLVGLYHWPGTGHEAGYAIAARLERLAQDPLSDVRLLYPEPPPPVQVAAAPATAYQRHVQAGASPVAPTPPAPPAAPASPPQRQAPYAIALDQYADNGEPRRTTFTLHRHLGCFWLGL